MALKQVPNYRTPQRSAATQTHKKLVLPPPVGGLNSKDPLATMDGKDAQILENFICRPRGAELRGGWQDVLESPFTGEVSTLMSYRATNPADNKLFACVGNSVFDVTPALDTADPLEPLPTLEVAEGVDHGYWSSLSYSLKTDKYLCAVANGAGYYTYDAAGGWVKREITGVDHDNLTSIAVWKNRLWFTQLNSSEVFYLGIGEVLGGEAKFFDYGPMFKRGGSVVAITNWTMDGGNGTDDYQLIFGSGGDVLVYKGTDPSNMETYTLVGVWSIGRYPRGDRFFTNYGGDVLVLSELGLTSMQQLITGNASAVGEMNPIINKIAEQLMHRLAPGKTVGFWEVRYSSDIESVLLIAPRKGGGSYEHYCLGLAARGWSTFTAMAIKTMTMHDRKTYIGTPDGRVGHAFDVNNDAMGVKKSRMTDLGQPVRGRVLSAYTDFGVGANLKRFLLARPIFMCTHPPSVAVRMRMDYASNTSVSLPTYARTDIATWDAAIWDQAYWSGSDNVFHVWTGILGVGYLGALDLMIEGERGLMYLGSHITAEVGGML
jgi:hypothetical protein